MRGCVGLRPLRCPVAYAHLERTQRRRRMANHIDLKGRAAVVTGGAQGFGKAITERFVASGARVAIWDRDRALAEKTAGAFGDGVVVVACDVTEPADVDRARDA